MQNYEEEKTLRTLKPYLLFSLPTLLTTGSLLPNTLTAPEHPPHLQVAQPHHHQGDQVGQDEVDKVVAGQVNIV